MGCGQSLQATEVPRDVPVDQPSSSPSPPPERNSAKQPTTNTSPAPDSPPPTTNKSSSLITSENWKEQPPSNGSSNAADTPALSGGAPKPANDDPTQVEKEEGEFDDPKPVSSEDGGTITESEPERKIPRSFSHRDTSAYRQHVLNATSELAKYQIPLSAADKAMVMQGWNKVLAFRTAFSEALLSHWRLLVALEEEGTNRQEAFGLVETNQDPIALALRERMWDAEDLLIGLLDGAIRSTCPDLQRVQREAYHPLLDDATLVKSRGGELTLECETVDDHLKLFARCGVVPRHWVLFCDAFVWAFQTHTPYAQQDDSDEMERGTGSAYVRVVAQQVVLPAIKAFKSLKSMGEADLYAKSVHDFWERLTPEQKYDFGEGFYRGLLTKHPHLLDYFSKTDMDSLAIHLMQTLDLIVASVKRLGDCTGSFRDVMNHLGESHRRIGIPTFAFALLGGHLVDCLQPHFEREETISKEEGHPVKAAELRTAFLNLYIEVMSLVYYPMLKQERMIARAREYYEQLKVEFNWSESTLAKRLLRVEEEIAATGTYTHTSKELEMGARLAWRNSAKCIGRISWNTLQVRDCRHINEPEKIFSEVETHLRLATAGTNIQSIMTVFKPQSTHEPFGSRFWSSQYVRYAGYKDEKTGKISGDPANAEITEYLLEHDLWTPPEPKGRFDVLPLVFKVPGRDKPFIYELSKDCVFEVSIEHPTRPEITGLGYRWTTVPAISNFKMDIGGVVYQNIPFNGWFMSTEIVRNLMERYGADEECAEAMGLDVKSDPVWRQNVAFELERAILHSFQKNGFTIVDPMEVGTSFCSHVRREREQFGRECPAQWSWIGGLTGPTNPTWHLEMRDFLIRPQYDYCIEGLALYQSVSTAADSDNAEKEEDDDASAQSKLMVVGGTPKVLILYGSETGNAESVARRLKRQLQLLKPILMTLNEAAGLDIVRKRGINHVISITSTFGKGEAPSNADKFFSMNIEAMPDVKYAVLALGSSLYPDFCAFGTALDARFAEARFDPLIGLTTADSAAGADGVIQDWLALTKTLILPSSLEQDLMSWVETISFEPPVNRFKWLGETSTIPEEGTKDGSTHWLCQSNISLLPDEAGRSVRKVTFEVPEGKSYSSGDHLSVQPLNGDAMVNRFLKCFETELVSSARQAGFEDESVSAAVEWQINQLFELEYVEAGDTTPADVAFRTPASLCDILKSQLDLSLGTRNIVDLLKLLSRFLDELIELADNEKGEREMILKEPLVERFLGIKNAIMNSPADEKTGLLDGLVAEFPSVASFLEYFGKVFLEDFTSELLGWKPRDPLVSLAEILAIMPKLQPRYYSISSSSNASPNQLSISVGVLNTETSKGVKIEGVCSHYMAGLQGGVDRAKVSVRTSTFRLPSNKQAPLLMVGAGTGLAPMMGFMEDRHLDRKNGAETGDIHLFFGCRQENEFIYSDTVRQYEQEDLIKLHLALSRAPDTPKKYVQHRLKDMGKDLSDLLLREDTHYYVCGDAQMAEDCHAAAVEALRMHAVMSRVSAVHHLTHMRMEGRWQTDVWGIVSNFEDAKKKVEKSKRQAAKIWLNYFGEEKES